MLAEATMKSGMVPDLMKYIFYYGRQAKANGDQQKNH